MQATRLHEEHALQASNLCLRSELRRPTAGCGPGKLGLARAPGKHLTGPCTGIVWRRDLQTDLDALRTEPELAVDTRVSLLEAHEYAT